MEKKQTIVVGTVIGVVVLGLFIVLFLQLSKKSPMEQPAIEPSGPTNTVPIHPSAMSEPVPATAPAPTPAPTIPTSVPVAQPKTTTDVANNISAQMDNEGKAIDVESQAEASQTQSDSNTLNSVDSSYDQTQN